MIQNISLISADVVFQFLTKNPCKRLGFSNEEDVVKGHPFFRRIDWTKMEAREVQPPIIPKVVMATCYLYPGNISHLVHNHNMIPCCLMQLLHL